MIILVLMIQLEVVLKVFAFFRDPILKISASNLLAGVFHELQVEMQVVDGRKRPAEGFFGLEEVAQVSAAVVAAAVAVAFRVER